MIFLLYHYYRVGALPKVLCFEGSREAPRIVPNMGTIQA